MKKCDVCGRPVKKKEEMDVNKGLDSLDIEEFEIIINAMGLSHKWETAVVCKECWDYYRE